MIRETKTRDGEREFVGSGKGRMEKEKKKEEKLKQMNRNERDMGLNKSSLRKHKIGKKNS